MKQLIAAAPDLAAVEADTRLEAQDFYYEALDPGLAEYARNAAETIRERGHKLVRSAIEIGAMLLDVKSRLPHGSFEFWVAKEFKWGIRTAERLMCAGVFSGKSDTMSYLPQEIVVQLGSKKTPADTRTEIVSEIEQGNRLTPTVIRQRIKLAVAHCRQEEEQRNYDAEVARIPEERRAYRARQLSYAERRDKAGLAAFEREYDKREVAKDQAAELIGRFLTPDHLLELETLLRAAGDIVLWDAIAALRSSRAEAQTPVLALQYSKLPANEVT